MELYFKIIKGPRKDDLFKISDGISLGRSKADLNLKDTKTSGIHGEVRLEKGELVFFDNNSTNGTLVNGERVEKVILKPGVSFKIGSTEIEVVTDLSLKKAPSMELSEWRESLYFQVSKLPTAQAPQKVFAFPKTIKIKIASGLMRGEEFILGYGPRTIGGGNSDILITGEALPLLKVELDAKGLAVLVDQSGDGIIFSGKNLSFIEIQEFLSVQCGDLILDVSVIE